jgi:hypothetical protein
MGKVLVGKIAVVVEMVVVVAAAEETVAEAMIDY